MFLNDKHVTSYTLIVSRVISCKHKHRENLQECENECENVPVVGIKLVEKLLKNIFLSFSLCLRIVHLILRPFPVYFSTD